MSQGPKHPFARYFWDVYQGVYTVLLGMGVTIKYFFTRPVTLQYPEQQPIVAEASRGLHEYNEELCIACSLCARACPVDCIQVETLGKGKDAMVLGFAVNYQQCIFCNLCVEACPTSAVWMTEKWDLASYTKEGCIRHFARHKSREEIETFKEEMARKEAERKAKAAAAAAAKKAKEAKEAKDAPKEDSKPKPPKEETSDGEKS